MSISVEKLTKEFEKCVAAASETLQALPVANRQVYAAWLAQTYYYVKHSTHLICLAAGNCPVDNRQTHYGIIRHLDGETNHDLIAVNDLKAMGLELQQFPELMPTRLLWQTQYYWLDRGPALVLYGYALLLEGLAVKAGPPLMAAAEAAHGKKAVAFLRVHSKEDVDHFAEGLKLMQRTTAEEREAIHQNLLQSTYLYQDFVTEIKNRYGSQTKVLKIAA